jgi:7-keto-8-aminopelargonate synthetase-like enzyme
LRELCEGHKVKKCAFIWKEGIFSIYSTICTIKKCVHSKNNYKTQLTHKQALTKVVIILVLLQCYSN